MARIAVVEDNRHLRDLLRTLLRLKAHEVETFPDGQAGLEGIDERFDLVLSDVQMPRLDGISLCRKLRERFSKTELPFITISVLDGEDDILRALEAGANDYLVKPFSPSLVKAKVGYHLKKAAPVVEDTKRFISSMQEEPKKFPVGFDRYTLRGILGKGSYGVVYDATRDKDNLKVALKILDRSVSDNREALARYFREIGSLSSIGCPHIVSFVSSGYESGRYFLAMEHVEGRSAWEEMQERGPLPVAQVVGIGADMSSALHAISEKGLVHRDLKPANIMLTPNGSAILVDFGLAKGRTEHDLTSPDEFLGTAEYIAPEVIRGSHEDVGTDLYALGVTLYELLVDSNPFTRESTMDVLRRVANGRPAEPLTSVNPAIPANVSTVIARLMHPDVAERLTDPAESEAVFRELASTVT